jgi:hypothetical protein
MSEEKIKVSWRLVYDAVQDYLRGEHGTPIMKTPHKDLDNNLVFSDCDGYKFGLNGLIEWYKTLVDDGQIEDDLGLLDDNIDVV